MFSLFKNCMCSEVWGMWKSCRNFVFVVEGVNCWSSLKWCWFTLKVAKIYQIRGLRRQWGAYKKGSNKQHHWKQRRREGPVHNFHHLMNWKRTLKGLFCRSIIYFYSAKFVINEIIQFTSKKMEDVLETCSTCFSRVKPLITGDTGGVPETCSLLRKFSCKLLSRLKHWVWIA